MSNLQAYLIACTDKLTGFTKAIAEVFPTTSLRESCFFCVELGINCPADRTRPRHFI
jgi:hypothetical protein